MIRRNVILPGGSSAWLLIAQVEHARVAFELAQQWGEPPFSSPRPQDVLLPTILRHDDGWRPWEMQPDVDEQTGRPLAFTEMATEVSHDIWKRSIDACEDLGPLSQYLISAHFLHLRSQGDSAETEAGRGFLQEYQKRSARWLSEWIGLNATSHTEALAREALQYLQLFDAISLWLCCDRVTASRSFLDPEQRTVTMSADDSTCIVVSPWPFTNSRLPIEITGRVVPVRAYQDAADLAEVECREFSLRWSLVPKI